MVKACKKCRRENEKLLLKADRCIGPKCAMVKRPYAPGQHGSTQRNKPSEYAKQLREKQKLKKIYNIQESHLRKYYNLAEKMVGNTAENLLILLETRIDNVVYKAGFFKSRSEAKQYISHAKAKINNKKVSVPSILTKPKDIIQVGKLDTDLKKGAGSIPSWIKVDYKKSEVLVNNYPTREKIDINVNENLIIEFYSR